MIAKQRNVVVLFFLAKIIEKKKSHHIITIISFVESSSCKSWDIGIIIVVVVLLIIIIIIFFCVFWYYFARNAPIIISGVNSWRVAKRASERARQKGVMSDPNKMHIKMEKFPKLPHRKKKLCYGLLIHPTCHPSKFPFLPLKKHNYARDTQQK